MNAIHITHRGGVFSTCSINNISHNLILMLFRLLFVYISSTVIRGEPASVAFDIKFIFCLVIRLLIKGTCRRDHEHGPRRLYSDVIMGEMASQITSLTIGYSTVYSGADERKHQSSASLGFVRGIHWEPVNSPDKWSVTRKMFPFDDVIMYCVFVGRRLY